MFYPFHSCLIFRYDLRAKSRSNSPFLAGPRAKLRKPCESPPEMVILHGILMDIHGNIWGWVKTLVPLVNPKIAGKWMFIPLKMVLIGIDPYPFNLWIFHMNSS